MRMPLSRGQPTKVLTNRQTSCRILFDNDYGISSAGSIANRTVMFYKLGFKEEIGVQYYYDDDISGKDPRKSKIQSACSTPETGEKEGG